MTHRERPPRTGRHEFAVLAAESTARECANEITELLNRRCISPVVGIGALMLVLAGQLRRMPPKVTEKTIEMLRGLMATNEENSN